MRRFLGGVMLLLLAVLAGCGGDQAQSLPWSDDFSAPESGWQVESDASAQVEYADGALRILIQAPNSLAWAAAGRAFSDFRLAVEATQVAGPDDNEYGVLVRMKDPSNFYRFSISGDGYYLVSKYEADQWELLSGDWAYSEAVNMGNATNLIEVVCQGAQMEFLVNGQQLVSLEDQTFSRGDIALYAGAFFEPGVEVHFDNFAIDQP
jgi:predicted small lipoprotein YifL